MQIRSDLWKELAASGNARMETSVAIGEHTYTPGSIVTVERASGQNALSCGNCVSAVARFSLAPVDGVTIPRTSAATVKCRFTDGERVSEWLTVGTFYVTRRQNNPVNGLLEFEGSDAMQKANVPYPSLSGFPKALSSAVMEIAHNMRVEIDGRTWESISTGGGSYVTLPANNEKMIKVLGDIGGICGGNWVITPRNKLRLVPLVSASGAASATDKVNIVAIMSGIATSDALTVTGVEASTGSTRYFAGSDVGGIVNVSSNPYANQALVNALLTRYGGISYAPFEIRSGIYDPALEIGDYIVSRKDVAGVIWKESARYAPAFRGDLSAPFASEASEVEQSLTDSISEGGAVTEDLSVRIYKFSNKSAVTVGNGQSAEIINFDYAAGVGQDVVFHAEIKHTTETTETGNASDGWTCTDAVITATYYINGTEVTAYHPVKTEMDGANLLHLTYHFENGRFNVGNFRVSLALSGGSVSIAAGDVRAYIIGQGYSGNDDSWIAEDGLIFISVENYPTMNYTTGDTLDLTGLVVKAYYADDTEKDVTAECVVTPAGGTTLEEGETLVNISYTEDNKEFRDSFSVYCDKDGSNVLYIDVLEPPTRAKYLPWEALNLDGLVIGAIQENGRVIKNIKPDCGFSPKEGDTLATPGTVAVAATWINSEIPWYGEFTTYFNVYVYTPEDTVASGGWWTLTNDGALSVYCAGDMPAPEWRDYRNRITTVFILDSVTSIADSAFGYCTRLTSVTIPGSVTSIGNHAFVYCNNLTSVTISDGVTSIGNYAFANCIRLTSVTIPGSVTSIGNHAFANCDYLNKLTILNGVNSIEDYAFNNCDKLTSVTIPGSVTSIGSNAFSYSDNLYSVDMSYGVTSIGSQAFVACSRLSHVYIPRTVTSIGSGAFSSCYSLQSVRINRDATVGSYAFPSGCTVYYYG